MAKALWDFAQPAEPPAQSHGCSKKMSDHIAYALLLYTGLNILLTVGAIKGALEGSILPYFSLVVLVAMIIPACRWLEKRWERFDVSAADQQGIKGRFERERALVWGAAVVLPVVITGAFKVVAAFA